MSRKIISHKTWTYLTRKCFYCYFFKIKDYLIVLILDSNYSILLICLRLFNWIKLEQLQFCFVFSEKTYFPSCVSNKIIVTILYTYFRQNVCPGQVKSRFCHPQECGSESVHQKTLLCRDRLELCSLHRSLCLRILYIIQNKKTQKFKLAG